MALQTSKMPGCAVCRGNERQLSLSLLPCVGRGSLVALHVEDLNFGRTVLNSSGIKVLFQQDLSR